MRAYAALRGKCPLCGRTFDLEYRDDEPDTVIKLNRGDAAILPNPVGYYMPVHRFAGGEFSAVPCPTSYRLVHPGR